jgi:signal transduction histidine kinase
VKSRATIIAVLLTAALLPALAALQYRWLGTLSELEHRRMSSTLHGSTERFCSDFDRDLTRIYSEFRSQLFGHAAETEEKLAEAHEEWAGETSHPELVKGVYWITPGRRGRRLQIQKLDLASRRLEDSERPDWLSSIEDDLQVYFDGRQRRSRSERSQDDYEERRSRDSDSSTDLDPLQSNVPALLVFGERERDGCAAVTLDRDVLLNRIFPERIREYFATGDDLDYDVLIVDASHPDAIVYRSAPELTHEDFADPDEEDGLFGLRLRSRRSESKRWRFLIRHRAGSLEAAVTTTRFRNLAVAFGALVLLAASMIMLMVTARRAHALARQQVEFVAGVSHELRTPLAGISSLSENLADGVIQDPERAREYGHSIHRETRRLGDMLERVLLFSRIESGKPYEMRPLDLAETIDGAIESARPWTAEKAAEVKKVLPEGLPRVIGNPRSLKMAIQNILVNAVKFSPEGSTILIRATEADKNVQIAVEDEGSGIPASELSHIFEPFYRGSSAREQQIEGSGLGLSIVKRILEAQGGRVTAKSELGKGTTIMVHLPVAETPNEP